MAMDLLEGEAPVTVLAQSGRGGNWPQPEVARGRGGEERTWWNGPGPSLKQQGQLAAALAVVRSGRGEAGGPRPVPSCPVRVGPPPGHF